MSKQEIERQLQACESHEGYFRIMEDAKKAGLSDAVEQAAETCLIGLDEREENSRFSRFKKV